MTHSYLIITFIGSSKRQQLYKLPLIHRLDRYFYFSNIGEVEIEPETTHQFIVTLDGLKSAPNFKKLESPTSTTTEVEEPPKKAKRPPSPIVFDKKESPAPPVRKIPDVLLPVAPIKSKERCKYWPVCKLGDSCEYIHPSITCKMFPMCKFGDRCLYIHPKCKFYASCTRKDCPYSHGPSKSILNTGLLKNFYFCFIISCLKRN